MMEIMYLSSILADGLLSLAYDARAETSGVRLFMAAITVLSLCRGYLHVSPDCFHQSGIVFRGKSTCCVTSKYHTIRLSPKTASQ